MKTLLNIATICLVVFMFLLFFYIVSGIVLTLSLCTFFFGLAIGLFVAWHYSKYKAKYEFSERMTTELYDHGAE